MENQDTWNQSGSAMRRVPVGQRRAQSRSLTSYSVLGHREGRRTRKGDTSDLEDGGGGCEQNGLDVLVAKGER